MELYPIFFIIIFISCLLIVLYSYFYIFAVVCGASIFISSQSIKLSNIKKTLSIETSCDDTSIGIIWFDGSRFFVEKLVEYSQIEEHNAFWWVVPELAYRSHENKIIWLIEDIWYDEIAWCDMISVTKFPVYHDRS